jgi:hypothetical protein
LAVATWLSGALVSLTRIGCGLARIRGLRRDARPFAGKAGVLISDKLAAPIAVGIFRPVAILPAEMTARLSARQLAQVIDHENAHVLRHDPAVALFQRLLAAALWFHPLLHWVNRRLDLAREELCDQAVLSSASPAEYSRTLLSIAAELPRARGLLRSELTSQLELRIKRLLSKRSDLMARANRWNIFALAAVFIALAVGAGCFGAAPSSRGALASATTAPADFPYAVKFEQGASKYTHHGDNITITEVHGTAATIEPGNIYRVSGTYVLKSHDAASIAAFTTAMNSADGTGSTMKVQAAEIKKGEGTFTLYLPMAIRGWPHVSFYPSGGGSDLGGTYFGNGEFVLKKWWGEK